MRIKFNDRKQQIKKNKGFRKINSRNRLYNSSYIDWEWVNWMLNRDGVEYLEVNKNFFFKKKHFCRRPSPRNLLLLFLRNDTDCIGKSSHFVKKPFLDPILILMSTNHERIEIQLLESGSWTTWHVWNKCLPC